MHKRTFLLVVVLLCALNLIAGCGGGGGSGTGSGELKVYQEPPPMPAPVTKQQNVDVSLPQGSSLNNETLKILSFYGTSQVPPKAQRLYKTIPVTVTDTDKGQIVILADSSDNPLFFSYLEATTGTATINSEGIAKALMWMNPYVMVLPADKRKEFMDKAITSTLFPQLKNKIDNLLVTDPKNLLNPDTHPEIVKTAFAIVKETFEKLINEQGIPKASKDIGPVADLRVLDRSGNEVSFENNYFTNYGVEIIDSTGKKIYSFVDGMEGIFTVSVKWSWSDFWKWKLPDVKIKILEPYVTPPIMLSDGKYSIKWYKGFNVDKVGLTGILIPIIPKEWGFSSEDYVLPGATISGTATWANTFDAIGIVTSVVADLPINKKVNIVRIAKDSDRIIGFVDFVNAVRSGDKVGTIKATVELLSNKDNWKIFANAIWGTFGPEAQDFLHNVKTLLNNIEPVLKIVDWINHDLAFFDDLLILAPWYQEYCMESTVGVLNECSGFVSLIPPTASLVVSPTYPYVGDTCTFDASGSTDDRTTSLQYRFDFDGDGTWDTNWTSNSKATYSYSAKGTYKAMVEVKDEDGLTAIATYYVIVYERGKGVSVAIVIDKSGSMTGPNYDGKPLADAKEAAKTFVRYMGSADRGAVISFDNVVTIDQPFTDNLNLLVNAIDNIQLGGTTAFYDAVYTAITETAKEDPNRRRAIIALTDGADNWSRYKRMDKEVSTKKLQDVVDYARQKGMPVYTIGLQGFDFDPNTTGQMLYDLAIQTNGIYFYAPDSSQLKKIYDTISGIK